MTLLSIYNTVVLSHKTKNILANRSSSPLFSESYLSRMSISGLYIIVDYMLENVPAYTVFAMQLGGKGTLKDVRMYAMHTAI